MIAAAVGLVVAAGGVHAQQSAGSVSGRGNTGDTVTVVNKAIGITRSATVDSNGAYQIGQLPQGTYAVTVKRADGSTVERTIEVTAGAGTVANFTEEVQRLVITGQARTNIDVKAVESTQILSKAQLDRIPVAGNVTAVAMLAPTATQGDSRIGSTTTRSSNLVSLGGASPAENTYYVNGFNVTNIVNGVAFNQVPWAAVASQEVKTGGYGAEFGRSLGGVMSTVTKRGTNEWHGGAQLSYAPDSLRGTSVYPDRVDNKWVLKDRPGTVDETLFNLYIGGPVIQDRLFVFGMVQGASYKSETYGASTQTELSNTTPQYLLKVDWNLNENNLIEFTAFSDKNEDKTKDWRQVTPYGTAKGAYLGPSTVTAGGENYIAQWTGQITNDFSLKALAGVGTFNRNSNLAGTDCPIVQDRRTSTILSLGCWTATTVGDPGAEDKRTAFRLDAEWKLGKHTLRAGLDNEKYEVTDGTAYSGVAGAEPALYQIRILNPGQKLANGYTNTGTDPLEYVRFRHFENGGVFTTKNSAFYIEDNWQITKDVMLYGGLRNEQFENLNADNKPFIDIKNTWAPRVGASWDVNGNADLKVFSTLGRYYIPVYANTNVRLSGRELDYQDFYAYGGSVSADRLQVPALGAKLGDRVVSSDGSTPDPRSVVDPNIKPMYQDEITLGFAKALADRWSFGVKYTHRELKSAMDDICNDEGAGNWAASAGYSPDQVDAIAGAIGHCFLANPGKDLTANVDLDGSGNLTPVTIPASALMNPKPKRTFDALEFTFDRAWDKKWMFQGSYVLAYSKGNTEGYVKSDIGQDDAGISQDFDYPGLMEGSEGYLPNDRRHTIKAFGAYALTDEWRLGANVMFQSGRPVNCFGVYGGTTDGVSQFYGDASFYCGGKLNPRGSFGRTPWTQEIGLQANYSPNWAKGLSLTVDVYNILNKRNVRGVEEGEDQGMNDPDSNYGRPIVGSLQRPRSVKFMATYEF